MRRKLMALIASGALLVGCTSRPPRLSAVGGGLPDDFGPGTPATQELPSFRPAVVLPTPPLLLTSTEGVPLSALSGREVALEDVLLSLFSGSDLNILVGDEVRRTLTFDVTATTMESAFISLLGHLDLAWRVQGGYVVVERQQQHGFTLQFPTVATDDGLSALDVQARLWEELTRQLQELLGTRGQVVPRPANGTMEVVAPPSLLALVADQIDAFQQTLLHPVNLRARVLELQFDGPEQRLDWDALAQALGLPPRSADGGLTLGFSSLPQLLAVLGRQGQVSARAPVRVTTRDGSPARLGLPLGPDGDLSLRVLPRATENGGIDLSVERPLTGADGATRVATARASVSSGQALLLDGPRVQRELARSEPVWGGVFHMKRTAQGTAEQLLLLEPSVSDLGFATHASDPDPLPAEQLLGREPLPGSPGSKASITRAGLAASVHAAGCQALVAGHQRQALSLFERATELDPERVDAWLHAAALELRTGRPRDAGRLADKALSLDPEDVLALTLGGLAELADENPVAALTPLRKAYGLQPNATSATNLAAALISAGQRQEAALILSEHHPDEATLYEPHLDRAYLHLRSRELTAARTELMQAATLGAPRGGERMVQLELMAHRLEQDDGLHRERKPLPAELSGLVDPDKAPDHFLNGWH